MKEDNANWSCLPVEILTKVFQLVIEGEPKSELCKFSLVCKTWSHSAQLILYSKININSLSQLQMLHSAVKNNDYLGKIVKIFNIHFHIPETDTQKANKLETFNYLSPLLTTYLPNLEELSEFALYSYTLTLDTLLDGGLKKLKILGSPTFKSDEKDIATYITCTLLMKDRLKNLFVSDIYLYEDESSVGQLCFKRLHNKLHKFDQLTSISIERKTNEIIHVLESIVENCKSLKEIDYCRAPTNNESDNTILLNSSNISVELISNFIPATNIKTLKIDAKLTNDQNLLLYIIHKFPQLHTLSWDIEAHTDPIHQLHNEIFTEFLNYLSGIKGFSVSNVRVDNDTVWDTIGNHWKETSKYGSKHVDFVFTKIDLGEDQTLLDFLKQGSSLLSSTVFEMHVTHLTWSVMDNFLSKNGMYISGIRLAFENVYVALENNYLKCTFTRCPNLRRLHLYKCRLKKVAPYLIADFSKRLSLDELYLDNCILIPGILEHWSLSLPELKCLRLRKITYNASEAQPSGSNSLTNHPLLAIVMPCTKIDLIIFEQDYTKKSISLKVFVVTNGTYQHYQYEPSVDGKISILTEEEYMSTSDSERIFICCQTITSSQFDV